MLAGVVLPQNSSVQFVTPEIRRVGDKLACKCGSCNNTIATCQMLQCHYSEPAREKIAKMQASGSTDQQVIDSFVQEQGLAALAVPPAAGFNLLGWIMPFIGVSVGLAAILFWIARHGKWQPAGTSPAAAVPTIDPRYRERIERETADLD
jgi:cytochrome c-type biogenesis protein CcmH